MFQLPELNPVPGQLIFRVPGFWLLLLNAKSAKVSFICDLVTYEGTSLTCITMAWGTALS